MVFESFLCKLIGVDWYCVVSVVVVVVDVDDKLIK